MKIPFKYLGLEIGGNPRKKRFWEPVVNKISIRLSTWRGRHLSLAGRQTTIWRILLDRVPTRINFIRRGV